jgi:hypothetical protein
MTEEGKTAAELELSEEDLKDPAKVTAAAEALEKENKEAKDGKELTQEEKVLHDQLGRYEKAKAAKEERLGKTEVAKVEKDAPATQETLSELDVDNRVFIRTEKLSQAKIDVLKEFQALPKNEGKSFEEIANTSAVKAEFKEIQDAVDASDEIEANGNEEKIAETKSEIYDNFVKTGKTPESEHERRIVAEKSLEAEGYSSV